MTDAAPLTLAITPDRDAPPLSAAQKRFNTLVGTIGKQRESLAAWNEAIALYDARIASELLPLMDENDRVQLELLQFLDRISDTARLGRNDAATLREVICEFAEPLLGGPHHDVVKPIMDRHDDAAPVFDTEDEAQLARLADDMADMTQPDDDTELRRAEILRMLQERLAADAAQAQAQRRPSASERRAAKEAEQATMSMRELYRKLASTLHPDRETDADARERKTGLMQRVNRAWQERNLLDLLQLQVEIEQIGAHTPSAMDDAGLARFNKLLASQLAGLTADIDMIEARLRMQFGLAPRSRLRPREVMSHYVRALQSVKDTIRARRRELASLGDPKTLKTWLRRQQREMDTMDFGDFLDDRLR